MRSFILKIKSPCLRLATWVQGLLDPTRLEDLTGLTELHKSSEAALQAWASSDEEEEGEEGEGEDGAGVGSSLKTLPAGGAGEEEWEEL